MDAVAIAGGKSSFDEPADIIGNEFYNINDDYAAIFINGGNFVDNYIHDINETARVLQVGDDSFIANNLIENCSGAAIFTSDYYSDAEIYCNTVRNNVVNLYIKCKSNAIITNNNFLDPIDYNVVLRGGSGPDPYLGHQSGSCSGIADLGSFDYFNLQGNYWGGLSPSELEESFFDVEEDFYIRQKVDYSDAALDTDCSIRIVSISEINQLEFKVFPNPTSSFLNLEIEAEIQSLEIYDQFGRLVMAPTDGSKKLDIGDLPFGVYYIRILSEGNIGNAKFVKN